jgi:ubiquinone/menaquinone biosynthesis C-methylase UbiE
MNIHYHGRVISAVPPGASTALDIGSGDGLLAFDLARRGLHVTAIDCDEASIQRARSDMRSTDRVAFVVGDVLTHAFEPESFDVVASIAMLHHVDAIDGMRRMRTLVRPGGVIAIVGFATPSSRGDVARGIAGALYRKSMELRGRYWEHEAPTCWPPPCSTAEMRDVVGRELPGAEFQPLLSGRYGVTWRAP